MPNNSLALQPLEYIAPENSFIFETLCPSGSWEARTKTLLGLNPIKKFYSLKDLDLYLDQNPEITKSPDAGVAGYINYEGDLEFFFYDSIIRDYADQFHDYCGKISSFRLSYDLFCISLGLEPRQRL